MNSFRERNYQFAPPVTQNLIIINAIFLFATYVLEARFNIDLNDTMGLHYFQADSFNPIQFVSYMFLHDGLSHLFFNMFSLWMFGRLIEQFWGAKRFLIFYVICGLTAALAQQIVWAVDLMPIVNSPAEFVRFPEGTEMLKSAFLNLPTTVGASGAVFGLLLAFGMLFLNGEIYLFFIPIPIKAKWFVIIYGLVELFLGVAPMAGGSNIAHFAHLGGMIGGIILILLWRRKGEIDGPYN